MESNTINRVEHTLLYYSLTICCSVHIIYIQLLLMRIINSIYNQTTEKSNRTSKFLPPFLINHHLQYTHCIVRDSNNLSLFVHFEMLNIFSPRVNDLYL